MFVLTCHQANNPRDVGCTYRGGFMADKRAGQGEEVYTNGETFVGTFQAGVALMLWCYNTLLIKRRGLYC